MEVNFKGTYYSVIDKKHRIVFPEEFVGVLSEYFAIYGKNKSINIIPKEVIFNAVKSLEGKLDDRERTIVVREIASCAYTIELDSEGRYELPLPLMYHTGFKIGDTVSIIGKDDRIEILLKR